MLKFQGSKVAAGKKFQARRERFDDRKHPNETARSSTTAMTCVLLCDVAMDLLRCKIKEIVIVTSP
jgi:hypothetical protein